MGLSHGRPPPGGASDERVRKACMANSKAPMREPENLRLRNVISVLLSNMLDLVLPLFPASDQQHLADLAPSLERGLRIHEDHQIDGLADQLLLRGVSAFRYQAFQPR